MRRAWLICLAVLFGCEPPAPPLPNSVSVQHDTAEKIPSGPLRGELRGERFEASTARFVVHGHGRERIDINVFSATVEHPCAHRAPSNKPSVWLRLPTATLPKAGEQRIALGDEAPAFEVHYQRRDGRRWVGSGRAAALLVIEEANQNEIVGQLSACFADGYGSCVAGAFTAKLCPDEIAPDVRDLRRSTHQ